MRFLFANRNGSAARPAIFFDRDGTINQRVLGGYVTNWQQFHFLPGIPDALQRLAKLPYPIIVVSNQAAVGKGLLPRTVLRDITERFVSELRLAGGRVDAVYYCPHTPLDGCACRKPRPGLLFEAARDWRIDLSGSVMVGDSNADVQSAQAAGCTPLLVRGNGNLAERICRVLERRG